jgi:CheY-like chemotaxis protein
MSLPIYQHPTMTVLVDDSVSFLHSLRFQLGPALPSITFSDAAAALAWLREQDGDATDLQCFLAPCVDSYTLEPQPFSVSLQVEQVCQLSRRARRFMTPSVLVIDYSMPQMDGIALCEAVRDLPCKKILLTGVADEKQAIGAFNRGLIDRFIRKGDRHALDRLEADIVSLQRDYFMARSSAARSLLSLRELGFVSDPAIAALVERVAQCYQIVEHYLYDRPSGFLMYDSEARPYLLVIETAHGMDAHTEMARDSGAPPALVNALQKRRVIPNFSGGDGMYSAAFDRDWYNYTAPAQECHGRELYYWAMFDLERDVPAGPVAPYSAFLRQHQATP